MTKRKAKFEAHERLPIFYDPISRRMFLRGLGASLAIPFLPSLLPRAEAATGNDNYFIFTKTSHGRNELAWYPQDANLSPVAGFPNVKSTPLSSIAGKLGTYLGNDFDDIRAKISILQGLDSPAANNTHGIPVYTGGGRKVEVNQPVYTWSADSILARSAGVYPTPPPIPVLRLNPRVGGASFSYTGNTSAELAYGVTVDEVWKVVSGFINPTTSNASSGGSASAAQAKKKLLIDRYLSEFNSVSKSTQIGGEDKTIFQNIIDHLTDLQKKLFVTAPAQPPPSGMSCPTTMAVNYSNNDDFNQRLIDVMTIAMACGVTRISTYDLNWDSCMDPNIGIAESVYHGAGAGVVHSCATDADSFYKLKGWWQSALKKYAYIVRRMDTLGLLDKSLVMYTSDYSSSTSGHHGHDMPVIMAGSLGGKFVTGEYISFQTQQQLPEYLYMNTSFIEDASGALVSKQVPRLVGRHFNEVFRSMFSAVGISPSEYQMGGQAGFSVMGCDTSTFDGAVECDGVTPDPKNHNDVKTVDRNLTPALTKYYTTGYNVSPTATLPYWYKG